MQYAMVFQYEGDRQFRTLEVDGDVWFYGIDVCDALEIKNPSDAYSRLDADDLGSTEGVDRRGRRQSFTIVSEAGLYALIFQSRLPGAKRFKRWVTHEVLPSIRRTGSYSRFGKVPAFIRRYNENWDRVSPGHFSVISELVVRLWGRLEQVGHLMADRAADGTELRPDVSVGRLFSEWLKECHEDVSDNYTYYLHWTTAGEFDARQYPNAMWPYFSEYVDTIWIPKHSERYFKTRDPAALPHLPRLLPPRPPARPIPRLSQPRPSVRP